MFTMEWPPRSGNMQEFPEIDKAEWPDLPTAMSKVIKSSQVFIERLVEFLKPTIPNRSLKLKELETAAPN